MFYNTFVNVYTTLIASYFPLYLQPKYPLSYPALKLNQRTSPLIYLTSDSLNPTYYFSIWSLLPSTHMYDSNPTVLIRNFPWLPLCYPSLWLFLNLNCHAWPLPFPLCHPLLSFYSNPTSTPLVRYLPTFSTCNSFLPHISPHLYYPSLCISNRQQSRTKNPAPPLLPAAHPFSWQPTFPSNNTFFFFLSSSNATYSLAPSEAFLFLITLTHLISTFFLLLSPTLPWHFCSLSLYL